MPYKNPYRATYLPICTHARTYKPCCYLTICTRAGVNATLSNQNSMRKHTRPKTGGRAKGTPNRLTTTLRETIQEALEAEASNLPDLLAQLKPSERVAAFTRLAQLVLPPRPQADQEHIEQPLFADDAPQPIWQGVRLVVESSTAEA